MQNVLSIFKYLRVFLVFFAIQIFTLYVYFSSDVFPSIQFLNSTKGLASKIVESQNFYTRYFGLLEENKKLRNANKKLLELNPKNYTRLSADLIKIKDTFYRQTYSFIQGDVLRVTSHKANNYITANIGKKQGVKRGMGVINNDGLIGYVYEVSTHYCLIKTLLSENITIDVSLKKSGQFGLLKWPGIQSSSVSITGIPNDTEIEIGEQVVTRGTGGVFPKGISVGRVSSLEFAEGESNWDLKIRPSVNFGSVKYVYVVKHLLKEELEKLEEKMTE
jgi:rod shape-determining protein MreC